MQTHTKHLDCVYLSVDATPAHESLSHYQPLHALLADSSLHDPITPIHRAYKQEGVHLYLCPVNPNSHT